MMIYPAKPTMEGAGVRLNRIFGFNEVPNFDPFLLLDHFGSSNPDDYMAGFPWHPHRGIETVTYMLAGAVEHGDSLGNSGVIGSGDVQWMSAGSGIVHQEMPERYEGKMEGFQLWVNLPANQKMMGPRYRDVKSQDIPEIQPAPGVRIKIIAGEVHGTKGPVKDLIIDTTYLDIQIEPGTTVPYELEEGFNAFCYVFRGSGIFNGQDIGVDHAVLFDKTNDIQLTAGSKGLRLLFISGKPLEEPVAWRGPIVMNTDEELATAFHEYQHGTFLKHEQE